MKKKLLFCLLLLPLSICAQPLPDPMAIGWDWEAALEAPRKSGYQDVLLGSEVICRLSGDYGNMRLLDEAGEEVPYLFFTEGQVDQEVSLKWYPRKRDDYWRRWYSRSVFQNQRADQIDRMVLKIRNADVKQTFWLSGSDDMNRWYIVKEDFAYDSDYDPASSYNLVTIDFPPVDYKYYKVEIRHHWHEPIQIMGAGYYSVSETEGHYQSVTRPEVEQFEKGSKSLVNIRFDAPHYLDRVFFEIDGPEMYHREAVLKRKTSHGDYELLESFVLDSRTVHLLHFESIRQEELRLEIENRDDKPLRVAAVQAMQLRKYLTAKLQREGKYTLKIGPESLRKPSYDLAYFGSDLPAGRASVKLKEVLSLAPPPPPPVQNLPPPAISSTPAEPREVPPDTPEQTKESRLLDGQVLLWIGIVLIILIVGFMAFRMLREME